METAGGIAGSKSPMVSRGTVRIESGEGSPPKPAGERGGGGGGGTSKDDQQSHVSATCLCVSHCIYAAVPLACLTSAF